VLCCESQLLCTRASVCKAKPIIHLNKTSRIYLLLILDGEHNSCKVFIGKSISAAACGADVTEIGGDLVACY
jgi:hypothetical protein